MIVLFVLLFCFRDNHFVDFSKDFRGQAFPEMHHGGRIEGWLAIVVARVSAKILQIRILLDLQHYFFVGIAILPLNQAGTQCQLKRLGYIAGARWEQISILFFDFIPWDRQCKIDCVNSEKVI